MQGHTHYCAICGTQVAVCDHEGCEHEGPQYCSVHVPQELHEAVGHPYEGKRIEDKPTVRMTVKVAAE